MKQIIYCLVFITIFSCHNAEVKTLATDNLEDYQKLIDGKALVLVDFNAPWCGPCKQLSPVLDEIAIEKAKEVEIIKINTDLYPQISNALQISGIPALKLYKNGKQIWEHVGLISKQDLRYIIASNQ